MLRCWWYPFKLGKNTDPIPLPSHRMMVHHPTSILRTTLNNMQSGSVSIRNADPPPPRATAPCPPSPAVVQQHTGIHSAWVSLPPSHSSLKGSGSGPAKTSRWAAAPRPSTLEGSSSPSAAASQTAQSFAGAPTSSASRERKRRSPAAALLCTLQRDDERHAPPPPLPPSPLLARLGDAVHHPRGGGGFRLGAVTAVRSPGDGGGASTVVGGGEELKEAFDAAVGEEGLLGLVGFRVSWFDLFLAWPPFHCCFGACG